MLFSGSNGFHFRRPFRLHRARAMRERHRGVYFYERRGGQLYRHSFIHRWLHDTGIRTVSAIVCNPGRPLPGTFNTFRGFSAALLPPVETGLAGALVEPILSHIHEILTPFDPCGAELLLDWFAHVMQLPGERTRLGLVVFGGFGCGKDFLSTWHSEHVVGPLYSEVVLHVSETKRVADSVLVLSRLRGGGAANLLALKELILRYDCRRRGRAEENYSNVFATTESPRFFNMVKSHREFVAFRCSETRAGDYPYFVSLRDYLVRPDVIRAWYQTLMARDLAAYRDTLSFQHAADVLQPWRPCDDDPPAPLSDTDSDADY